MSPDQYHLVLLALREAERNFEASSQQWTDDDRNLCQMVKLIRSEVLKRESGHPFAMNALKTLRRDTGLPAESVARERVGSDAHADGSEPGIRLLVADDDPIVRSLLRLLTSATPDIAVVAEAKDGLEAVEEALVVSPDVILMDVDMPAISGMEASRIILRVRPQSKIVVFTGNSAATYEERAAKMGIAGFLLKPATNDALMRAIRDAHAGRGAHEAHAPARPQAKDSEIGRS